MYFVDEEGDDPNTFHLGGSTKKAAERVCSLRNKTRLEVEVTHCKVGYIRIGAT